VAIHRIEVADPIEGDAIRAALRERGLVVVKRSVDDVTRATEAALVILAADAPGGLDALASLRATASTAVVPVILIGSPEGSGLDAARASLRGADAWYARPVALERLARKVETFLAPAESRLRARTDPGLTPPPLSPRSSPPILGPITGPPAPTTQRLAEEARAAAQAAPQSRPEPSLPLSSGPERTLRLDADGEPIMMSAIVAPRPPSFYPPTSANALEPADDDAPEASVRAAQPPPPPISDISPLLHGVLIAADHRVFPRASPLDLSFAADDEPPEKLVPDELLEDVGAPFEMPDEDPLESFTHIGPIVPQSGTPMPIRTPSVSVSGSRTPGPFTPRSSRFERPSSPPLSESGDLLAPGSGAGVSSVGSSPGSFGGELEQDDRDAPAVTTTSTRPSRSASQVHRRSTIPPARARGSVFPVAAESSLGEPSADGQSRSGSVGDAGLVAVFAALALRRIDALLTVTPGASLADETRLVVVDGEVRSLAGDIARRTVAQLRRERRAADEPQSEHDAELLLTRRVETGALAPFELDRRLGRAREELLFDLLAAPSARFALAPLQSEQLAELDAIPRPFARPLLALVVEGARRRLDAVRVARLLGPASVRVVRTADLAPLLAATGIAPELAALLTPAGGATFDALCAAAPAEEGVPGAVYAFVCAGALRVEAAPVARDVSGAALERAKRELAALAAIAEDGDYFAVLGLARDAHPRELRDAHDALSRAVRALPLDALGLAPLEPTRTAILAALDDALDVLADDRLRARYAAALDA